MSLTSSPHDAESLILIRTSVPLPRSVFDGRQRQRLFFASRTRMSGPPVVRSFGAAARAPEAAGPGLEDRRRLLLLEVDPPDRRVGRVEHVRRAVRAADERLELGRVRRPGTANTDVEPTGSTPYSRSSPSSAFSRSGAIWPPGYDRPWASSSLRYAALSSVERATRVVGDEVDAGAADGGERRLRLLERLLRGGERLDGARVGARPAEGVDADDQRAGHGDQGEQRHRRPALGLHARCRRGDLPLGGRPGAAGGPGRPTRPSGPRCPPRPSPGSRTAPTAAAPAVMESARGIGPRSGAPGERLRGTDRDERAWSCASRRSPPPRRRPPRRSPSRRRRRTACGGARSRTAGGA